MNFKEYLRERSDEPDEKLFKSALKETMWDFTGKAFTELDRGQSTMHSPGKVKPQQYLSMLDRPEKMAIRVKELTKFKSENWFIKYFLDNAESQKSKSKNSTFVYLVLDLTDPAHKAKMLKAVDEDKIMSR